MEAYSKADSAKSDSPDGPTLAVVLSQPFRDAETLALQELAFFRVSGPPLILINARGCTEPSLIANEVPVSMWLEG